jgi:hypothetical protein
MAIDLQTLKATTFGDPETKLSVKRAWLGEVYKLLIEGASYKQKYENLRRELDKAGIQVSTSTISPAAQNDLDEGMTTIDKGMDKIFGDNGAFSKIFGKGK